MGRYRSAFTLPFPREWDIDTFGSPRYAFGPGAVGLIPVLAAIGAAVNVGSGGGGAIDFVMIAFCVVFAGLTYAFVWRVWPMWADVRAETVTREGEAALSIPLRPPTRTAAIGSGVVGALLIVGGVAMLVRSFGSDPSSGYMWFAGLGMAGVLLLFLARVSFSTPVRATAEILLTPEHLRIDDGEENITLAWDDISAIRADHVRKYSGSVFPVPGANLLAVLVHDPAVLGSDAIPIADDRFRAGYLAYEFAHKQFASDPLLTFHALTFYWSNPRLRHELGTDAALDRFFGGRYESGTPGSDVTVAR